MSASYFRAVQKDSAKRIQELEEELSRRRKHHASVSNALNDLLPRKSPIARLPREILLLTFKLVIVNNPTDIRYLLFICCDWYQLICGTSHLWSRIDLCPTWEIGDATFLLGYLNSALKYSRALPLNVTVDLTGISRLETAAIETVTSGGLTTVEEIAKWLQRLGDMKTTFPPLKDQLILYSRLFRGVIGTKGQHLKRWRSFHLRAAGAQDTDFSLWEFVECLGWPAPLLESMVIEGLGDLHEQIDPPSRLRAPKLRTLVADVANPLDFCPEDPTNLEDLRVPFGIDGISRMDLCQFIGLKHLYLSSIPSMAYSPVTDPPFSLPFLEQLSIHGHFAESVFYQMELPELKIVRLLDSRPMAIFRLLVADSICKVKELHLLLKKDDEAFAVAAQYIWHFPQLERLVVPEWNLNYVSSCIKELVALYGMPKSLKLIGYVIGDTSGKPLVSLSELFWKPAQDFTYGWKFQLKS